MNVKDQMANEMIDFLNSLLEIDRRWVTSIINRRAPCNAQMATHPSVQVRKHGRSKHVAGVLGLLNGMCGTINEGEKAGYGPITMIYGDEGLIERFARTESI